MTGLKIDLARPEETPRHNTLQALFLNQTFCDGFAAKVIGDTKEFIELKDWYADFEISGWDARLSKKTKSDDWCEILIEIKPYVGDDYPAVLRQMHSQKSRYDKAVGWGELTYGILLIGKFDSLAISQSQLVDIFWRSDFQVFFISKHLAEAAE